MRIALRLAALAVACSPLFSTPLMNQIDPAQIVGASWFASQRFEASNAAFNTAFIDDFTVSGGVTQLGRFQAVLTQTSPAGFQNVQNWAIEIYSSVAGASTNLTGNVASQTFLPGEVTLGGTFNGSANTALLTIDLTGRNILLGDGTYWIGLLPRLDAISGGQLGVVGGPYTGVTPGGNNGFQVNPGGGFGFPGGISNRGVSVAYNLESVPEPATVLLTASALAFLMWRRKTTRVSGRS